MKWILKNQIGVAPTKGTGTSTFYVSNWQRSYINVCDSMVEMPHNTTNKNIDKQWLTLSYVLYLIV